MSSCFCNRVKGSFRFGHRGALSSGLLIFALAGSGSAATSLVSSASGTAAAPLNTTGAFDSLPPVANPLTETGEGLIQGMTLSASLSGTYDTNPSQGYSTAEDSGKGDYFTTLGGILSYQSTASTVTFGGSYNGSYSEYLNQSNLSGYNQSANGSVKYDAGSLSAAVTAGINYGSGANRYYEAVVDQISYNFGLNAQYRLSSKTSLNANLSNSFTSASGSGSSDTESFDFNGSALWKYSPLTEIGPGLRYTSRSSDSQDGRQTIGPTVSVNYNLSKKVSLNSRVGVDFTEYDNGGSGDPALSTAISLRYKASALWGMNFALNRDVESDPTQAGDFYEVTALRLGFDRKIRRATLNMGVSFETRTSEQADSNSSSGRPDQDYLTLDSSLGMPVFSNSCNASVFIRYRDQDESGGGNSWDSFQTGFSISRSF